MYNDTTNLKEILSNNANLVKFITDIIKNIIETLMKFELTGFLNYEKYDRSGHNSGNSINGYYTRDYETKYGKINNLHIPRDRNGEFEQNFYSTINVVMNG